MLIECAVTVAALVVFQPNQRPLDAKVMAHLPLVTLAKALNMILSFIAMRYTSLPVYNVLKRLNVVFSVAADMLLRGTLFSREVLVAVLLITLGALVTGSGDLDFNVLGYLVAIPAGLMNASYLVLSARAHDRIPGLTHVEVLFYTAFFNIFIFAPLSCLELSPIVRFFNGAEEHLGKILCILFSYVVLGCMLNYATFWCTTANSPVTTGVTGNLKGIFSTWVGFAFFGSSLTAAGWVGLALNTVGGAMYPLARWREARRAALTEANVKKKMP